MKNSEVGQRGGGGGVQRPEVQCGRYIHDKTWTKEKSHIRPRIKEDIQRKIRCERFVLLSNTQQDFFVPVGYFWPDML